MGRRLSTCSLSSDWRRAEASLSAGELADRKLLVATLQSRCGQDRTSLTMSAYSRRSIMAADQRLRPRRHRRPPPDAPPRRLLRRARARSCPATSSPPRAAPASSTWRPITARTISSCARRTASTRSSRSKATASIAPTGSGWAAQGIGHQPQVQRARRPDLHATCAKRAGCSRRRADYQALAIRIAGAPRPR